MAALKLLIAIDVIVGWDMIQFLTDVLKQKFNLDHHIFTHSHLPTRGHHYKLYNCNLIAVRDVRQHIFYTYQVVN